MVTKPFLAWDIGSDSHSDMAFLPMCRIEAGLCVLLAALKQASFELCGPTVLQFLTRRAASGGMERHTSSRWPGTFLAWRRCYGRGVVKEWLLVSQMEKSSPNLKFAEVWVKLSPPRCLARGPSRWRRGCNVRSPKPCSTDATNERVDF